MTLWGEPKWDTGSQCKSMTLHTMSNVRVSDCRVLSIAQELNWQAEGDTHATTHWPSTPCTQQEKWYTYGQLKALITADEWLWVDRATKHKSLLTLLLFLLLSISHELPLAKLHWSVWATCCHCWRAVYIVPIAEDIGNKWRGEMKPLLPSSLPNNSPHHCRHWRDL